MTYYSVTPDGIEIEIIYIGKYERQFQVPIYNLQRNTENEIRDMFSVWLFEISGWPI